MSSVAEAKRSYFFPEQTALLSPLAREVQDTRLEKRKHRETPWYYLSGTGFFVKAQSDAFFNGYKKRVLSGESPDRALKKEFTKVKADIVAFEDEYLKQLAGLRWNIGFKEVQGKKRIVATGEYNDTLLEEITDKSEREGAVYDLWFRGDERNIPGVEEWLCKATPNSMAVIVSPAGWSGMYTPEGRAIRFPETQVYAARVDEKGQAEGYTFRWKADIEKNEKLQKRLGLEVKQTTDQKERIKQALKNVAFISADAENKVRTVADVVNAMEEVNGSNTAFEGKTFGDIRRFLCNPQPFLYRHPQTPLLLAELENFVQGEFSRGRPETEVKTEFQIALALTVLKLNKLYREQKDNSVTEERHEYMIYEYKRVPDGSFFAVSKPDIEKELRELRKKGGCSGGNDEEEEESKESGRFGSMGSSRRGEISLSTEESYGFDHDGVCVVCDEGPQPLGPCEICKECDGKMREEGR